MKVSFFLIFYLALGRAREPRGRRRKLDYHKRDGNKSFLFFFFLLFWSQCSSYTAVSDIRAFDFFCLVGDF